MRKCRRGKGTISYRYRREPEVISGRYHFHKNQLERTSLSIQNVSSKFSTNWWTERVAIYGSTTVPDTLGDGATEKVAIMRSGNSSWIFAINNVPIPAPVPPPREW